MQCRICHDDMHTILRCTGTSTVDKQMLQLYHEYPDTGTQYPQVCFDCQMGLANMQCCICHKDMPRILQCTGTSTIGQQILRLCHEYPETGTLYRLDYLYTKWNRQICSDRSVIMICAQDSQVHRRIQGISSWQIQHCIFANPIGHKDSLSGIE